MRFRIVLPLIALVVFVIGLAGWLGERGDASSPAASQALDPIQRAIKRSPTRPPRGDVRTVATAAAVPAPPGVTDEAPETPTPPQVWGNGEIDTTWDAGPADRARYGALAASHDKDRQTEQWVVRWAVVPAGDPVVDADEVGRVAEQAYADPRGWSLRGAIRFERTTDPDAADFLLVVAEAAVIPEYSEDCVSWQTGEPDASCTVGSAVIINDQRWRDGALGDSIALGEFRVHEINHETGHWLGQGHFSCLGGTAAVNQQQFRSLAGCVANGWPLPWEQAMVATRFGLWPGVDAYEPYDEIIPPESVYDEAAEAPEATTDSTEGVDDGPVTSAADETGTTDEPASVEDEAATRTTDE